MTEVVFFLEEPSAREMLQGLSSRLLPEGVCARYVVFEGKQDLHERLERRLRGWMDKDTRFIVLRDKDSGNCVQTKQELCAICEKSGKQDSPRSLRQGNLVVTIAPGRRSYAAEAECKGSAFAIRTNLPERWKSRLIRDAIDRLAAPTANSFEFMLPIR